MFRTRVCVSCFVPFSQPPVPIRDETRYAKTWPGVLLISLALGLALPGTVEAQGGPDGLLMPSASATVFDTGARAGPSRWPDLRPAEVIPGGPPGRIAEREERPGWACPAVGTIWGASLGALAGLSLMSGDYIGPDLKRLTIPLGAAIGGLVAWRFC
jgi:hypothetical protein